MSLDTHSSTSSDPAIPPSPSGRGTEGQGAAREATPYSAQSTPLKSQITDFSDADRPDDQFDPALDYRALPTSVIAAFALGLLSALALFDWWLGLIPLAALVFGLLGLRAVRRAPDEYTGGWLATTGIALALLFWIGGATRLTYVYVTEIPAGYERLSYATLQPFNPDELTTIPDEAKAMSGKKVFIKGYVYPGTRTDGITQFLLVRDQGTCCFGGDPKITDRIQVQLSDRRGFRFSNGVFKVAGTFRVAPPQAAVDGPGSVFYFLDNATLQ